MPRSVGLDEEKALSVKIELFSCHFFEGDSHGLGGFEDVQVTTEISKYDNSGM